MDFNIHNIYHVYNRGNNRQPLFFKRENYLYFLKLTRKFLLPKSDLLAYSLMPNHFHFQVHANEHTISKKLIQGLERNEFGEGIRMLLSSYTQAINKQEGRTGSLFTQNTKSKCLNESSDKEEGPFVCFHYIHQNAFKAGLVQRLEDWEFSSFRDYAGLRKGTLCNLKLGVQLLNLDKENFVNESYAVMRPELYERIW